MASALAKNLVKVGIGVGAVYVTLDQGIWSNSEQASSALHRIKTKYLSATNDYINKIPNSQEVNDKVVDTWNGGVKTAIDGVAATPGVVSEYSKKALTSVKQNIVPGGSK